MRIIQLLPAPHAERSTTQPRLLYHHQGLFKRLRAPALQAAAPNSSPTARNCSDPPYEVILPPFGIFDMFRAHLSSSCLLLAPNTTERGSFCAYA